MSRTSPEWTRRQGEKLSGISPWQANAGEFPGRESEVTLASEYGTRAAASCRCGWSHRAAYLTLLFLGRRS